MTLPTEIVKAGGGSPLSMILYGPPKIGKTEALAALSRESNFLMLDLENGSEHVDALKIKVNDFEELTSVGSAIMKAKNPYTGLIVDTATELESWCEWDATEMYMASPMGKAFNSKAGQLLPKSQWDSVLTLPRGAGYLWHRLAFKKWKEKIDKLAKHKIYVAHVKDIFLEKEDKQISAKDLDLTGKIKNIACGYVDAIGYLYRDPKNPLELRVSFKNNNEDIAGSRSKHLRNQDFVLIENNEDGSVKTSYWNKIFI